MSKLFDNLANIVPETRKAYVSEPAGVAFVLGLLHQVGVANSGGLEALLSAANISPFAVLIASAGAFVMRQIDKSRKRKG